MLYQKDNKCLSKVPGQISVFDYLEWNKQNTPTLTNVNKVKYKSFFSSLKQQEVYMYYLKKYRIARGILYCHGAIGVEVIFKDTIATHCIDIKGYEYAFHSQSRVLPMDKIIYYSSLKIKNKKIQLARLKEQIKLNSDDIQRIIQRKGDFNILIEYKDRVSSILRNGWVLDFYSINKVECSDEEILKVGL